MRFPKRKPWDLNPQRVSSRSRFQDGVLIQPDDFRCIFRIQAARVGIEPTASRFRAERCYQQQLSRSILFQSKMDSSGSRIRTYTDCFKGRRPTISRSPTKTFHSKTFRNRVSCGSRTRLSELEVQHLCRSAKDTFVFIAATTGLEPAFDSLTVSCRTVWLHRSVRDLRSQG